jgi:hypothetical protein
MFEKPFRNAMYGIAEIRNLFAHQLDMQFQSTDQKLIKAAKRLTLHEGLTHFPNPGVWERHLAPIDSTDTVRDKFLVNLKVCLLWLAADYWRHLPWSIEHRPVRMELPSIE